MPTIRAILFILSVSLSSQTIGQERCFKDAKSNFDKWRAENGKVFDELAAKYLASKDPKKEKVSYGGMEMPIAAALIIESDRYGADADKKLEVEVNGAKKCSNQTVIPRGTYDLARELMGLTTVLPEKATRIDFEELRRGNLLGGDKSLPREAGRKIERALNPARWF